MTKISNQFQLRISFKQFLVATTGRRGGKHYKSNIEGRHLKPKHEVKEAQTVEERAGMQRIWNDPSQTTEDKELRGAKAAERLKTLTNPEIFSLRGKDNGQSRKKQEWTEYTLTRSYGPSQRARRERKRTKQQALHSGIEDFICSSSFIDIETFYAGK